MRDGQVLGTREPCRYGRPVTDRVRAAYGERAAEYAAVLGSMDSVHADDRALVERWAAGRSGTLLDAGCGPGHWSGHLVELGHRVVGIDAVPWFVGYAARSVPAATFRTADLAATGLDDGSVDGILAWYSLVHHEPEAVPAALAEFRRVLRPGGGLLVGFFEGPETEPFAHAITTAWRWPVAWAVSVLEGAGFAVEEIEQRTGEGHRPHGAVRAVRR